MFKIHRNNGKKKIQLKRDVLQFVYISKTRFMSKINKEKKIKIKSSELSFEKKNEIKNEKALHKN